MSDAEVDDTQMLAVIAALVKQAQAGEALVTFLDKDKFRHVFDPTSFTTETGELVGTSYTTSTEETFLAKDLSEFRILKDIT